MTITFSSISKILSFCAYGFIPMPPHPVLLISCLDPDAVTS